MYHKRQYDLCFIKLKDFLSPIIHLDCILNISVIKSYSGTFMKAAFIAWTLFKTRACVSMDLTWL